MSREPSLHITQKELKRILTELFNTEFKPGPTFVDDLVLNILKQGKRVQLTGRSILENKKDAPQMARVKSSKLGDADLFNKYLSMVRQKLRHRGFKKIFQSSKDWQFIKESAGLANEFYDQFSDSLESKDQAYSNYISLFFEMLEGGFSVRRIASYHERIIERYSAAIFILNSGVVDEATEMHQAYQTKIEEKTGNRWDYTNRPEEFINFVKAIAISKEIGLSINKYVKAQFDSLDWASAIPYPKQLANVKAKEKAIRWMSENNIRREKVVNKKDMDRLKNLVSKYENNIE